MVSRLHWRRSHKTPFQVAFASRAHSSGTPNPSCPAGFGGSRCPSGQNALSSPGQPVNNHCTNVPQQTTAMEIQCCKGPIGLKKPDIMFKIDHATVQSPHTCVHILRTCDSTEPAAVVWSACLESCWQNAQTNLLRQAYKTETKLVDFQKIPTQRVYVCMCASACVKHLKILKMQATRCIV